MADKTHAPGAAGRAPVAGQPESVRNVVLVGHSGAGKTTLAEALLAATGTIQRPGRVEDGTTVSDFDEVEVRQQRSVNLTLVPFEHAGVKVNLLDTPGYADFTGDLRAGLRAADAALFTVSAAERRRRADPDAVGGVRGGGHAARGRDHQDRPSAGRLRRGPGRLPGRVRRVGGAAVPARRRRRGRRARPHRPAVRALLRLLRRQPGRLRGHRGRRRPGGGGPLRADRGDHPGERGRDPHGPVPVR